MSDSFFDNGKHFDVPTNRSPELGRVNLQNSLSVDVATLASERFTYGSYLKTVDNKSEFILDENGRTILLFKGEGRGTFNSVYSPLTKGQLRREILVLPEGQQNTLSQMLKLPNLTPTDIDEFKRIQAKREEDKGILNAALALPSAFNVREQRNTPRQEQIRGILQKEYAITNADSDIPIIGTFGLGPCIALTIYDPVTRLAALAHVDGTTRVDSLGRIFSDISVSKNEFSRLQVGLIGGDLSSRKQAVEMVRYLRNNDIKLSFVDIIDKPHPSAFVIDARNGAIIPNVTPTNNGEEKNLRMQLSGLQMNGQIKKEFDGRFS